jgi:hypothetical protein
VDDLSYYRQPGPLTTFRPDQRALIRPLGLDALGLCQVAQNLIWPPDGPDGSNLTPDQLAQRNARPAAWLLDRALELDGRPLAEARPVRGRVIGTCRHFAVMAVALLRACEVPARARCGFATYFQPPQKVDHWVTEYWAADDARWVRIDPEIIGLGVVPGPEDLAPGLFLTAGEAWQLVRAGTADPNEFGVGGTDNWGPAEIRGNLLRDLAALVKVEMLPWDEWGPMKASYDGLTDAAFDRAMDELAKSTSQPARTAVEAAYAPYAVPEELVSQDGGGQR